MFSRALLPLSPGTTMFKHDLHDWQYGVLVVSPELVKLWDHRVVATLDWTADPNVLEAQGIVIIDGASHTRVRSNESRENGRYTVEFATDTYRFGFLTPAAFDDVFVAGAFPTTRVKDCGNGNRIVSGVLVNNTLEPCN